MAKFFILSLIVLSTYNVVFADPDRSSFRLEVEGGKRDTNYAESERMINDAVECALLWWEAHRAGFGDYEFIMPERKWRKLDTADLSGPVFSSETGRSSSYWIMRPAASNYGVAYKLYLHGNNSYHFVWRIRFAGGRAHLESVEIVYREPF